jgi:hypothetical protein
MVYSLFSLHHRQIVLKVAITCKKCKTCVLGIASKVKGKFILSPSPWLIFISVYAFVIQGGVHVWLIDMLAV